MNCTCGKDHDKTKTPCLCPSPECGGNCIEVVGGPGGRSGGYWTQYYCLLCQVRGPLYKAKTQVAANRHALRGFNGIWATRTPDARLEKVLRAIADCHAKVNREYVDESCIAACDEMNMLAEDALKDICGVDMAQEQADKLYPPPT